MIMNWRFLIAVLIFVSFPAIVMAEGPVSEMAAPEVPEPPKLLSPADGFKVREGNVTLEWSRSQEEGLFRIQISATPNFSRIITDETIPHTQKMLENLAAEGRYY